MDLIPEKLHVFERILRETTADMKEEYILAVKKAIEDFVLKDPYNPTSIIPHFESVERIEAVKVGLDFHTTFRLIKRQMELKLHSLNPCISEVITLWTLNYE